VNKIILSALALVLLIAALGVAGAPAARPRPLRLSPTSSGTAGIPAASSRATTS
jgi:hypothetical protein